MTAYLIVLALAGLVTIVLWEVFNQSSVRNALPEGVGGTGARPARSSDRPHEVVCSEEVGQLLESNALR